VLVGVSAGEENHHNLEMEGQVKDNEYKKSIKALDRIEAKLDIVRAKMAELEKDKGRLDWLQNNRWAVGEDDGKWILFQDEKDSCGDTLRQAIDAAMAQQKSRPEDRAA